MTNQPDNAADARTVPFGKLPLRLVQAGIFRTLARTELAVYIAIAGHVNGETWEAWPSVSTIAQCAGVCDRTARRSIARLEESGLLTVRRGRGRRVFSRYELATKGDALAVTFSDRKTGHPRAKKVTPEPDKGTSSTRKGDTPRVQQRTENSGTTIATEATTADAAAGSKQEAEVRRRLRSAGIGNPTLRELARMPGITPELVEREAARLNGTGKGPPILIENLRSASNARSPARCCAPGEEKGDRMTQLPNHLIPIESPRTELVNELGCTRDELGTAKGLLLDSIAQARLAVAGDEFGAALAALEEALESARECDRLAEEIETLTNRLEGSHDDCA